MNHLVCGQRSALTPEPTRAETLFAPFSDPLWGCPQRWLALSTVQSGAAKLVRGQAHWAEVSSNCVLHHSCRQLLAQSCNAQGLGVNGRYAVMLALFVAIEVVPGQFRLLVCFGPVSACRYRLRSEKRNFGGVAASIACTRGRTGYSQTIVAVRPPSRQWHVLFPS
jgi:hypothetical protein